MIRRVFSAGMLLMVTFCAHAQTPDPATRELIQKLLARIDSLEKRVSELEGDKAPRAAVAAPKTPAQDITATHAHDQAPLPPDLEQSAQPVYPSLKFAGFADVNFSATDPHGPFAGFGAQTLLAAHSGFALGQTTLHMSSALSHKVSFFGELTFTPRTDAGPGAPAAACTH